MGALVLHAWALAGVAPRASPRAVDAPAALTIRAMDAAPLPSIHRPPETETAEAVTGTGASREALAEGARPDLARESPADTPGHAPSSASLPAEAVPAPASLAIPLRGDGALAYAFVVDGHIGEASLSFRIEDDRYEFTLARRAGAREWPLWHSEGRVGAQGLLPERHRVLRQGRERERLTFDRASPMPVLRVGARAFPLSDGTQDRLSWWMQLAALMAAEPAPRTGLRWRLPVASATGVHGWDFEVVARDGDRWLLRREMARGAARPALQWSVWLDGQRGFLPVELRFSLDDQEQWALRLLE